MYPYFIILFLIMILLGTSKEKRKVIPFFISFVILVIFGGLRSNNVGTDTNNYIGIFNNFQAISEPIFSIKTNIEIGYLFLQKIAMSISYEYWSLLLLISILSVAPIFIVINKLSVNVYLSVFVYITIAYYLLFFNAGRQGIAVSISSISLIYILDRKIYKFLIVLFIASLFHKTVVILLPFYFILNLKVSLRHTIFYLLLGVIAFSYMSFFLSFFSSGVEERYSGYENRGATGGYLLSLFFIIANFILYKLRKHISIANLKHFDIYLNSSLFVAIIYFVVITTGADVNLIRLTNYFMIGYVLIWPIVFKEIPVFRKSIIRITFVAIHLLFFAIYITRMSNLIPYSLNTDLF